MKNNNNTYTSIDIYINTLFQKYQNIKNHTLKTVKIKNINKI